MALGDAIPAAAILQVDDQRCLLALGEGVAVVSHARCSTHLGQYTIAHNGHRVVARAGHLLRAVGKGPHATVGVYAITTRVGNIAHNGHNGDIKQVANTRTRKVCMREADQR